MSGEQFDERPYADPNHPGNKTRPNIRCVQCGKLGAITAWGPWCFEHNVERMDRIGKALKGEISFREGRKS